MIIGRPPRKFPNGGSDYKVGSYPFSSKWSRGRRPAFIKPGATEGVTRKLGLAPVDLNFVGGRELIMDSIIVDYAASKIIVEAAPRVRRVTLRAQYNTVTVSTQSTVTEGAGVMIAMGEDEKIILLPANARLYGIASSAAATPAHLNRRIES